MIFSCIVLSTRTRDCAIWIAGTTHGRKMCVCKTSRLQRLWQMLSEQAWDHVGWTRWLLTPQPLLALHATVPSCTQLHDLLALTGAPLTPYLLLVPAGSSSTGLVQVSQPNGEVIITNDGATILNMLSVTQPAAKMLVELSKSQVRPCHYANETSHEVMPTRLSLHRIVQWRMEDVARVWWKVGRRQCLPTHACLLLQNVVLYAVVRIERIRYGSL